MLLMGCAGTIPSIPHAQQTFPRPLEEVWQAGLGVVKIVRYSLASVQGSIQEGHVLISTRWKVYPGYATRHYSEDVWERFAIFMKGMQKETTVEVRVEREVRTRSYSGFTIQLVPQEQRERREREILAGIAHLLER